MTGAAPYPGLDSPGAVLYWASCQEFVILLSY